jgi:hypothetical protein
VSWGELVDRITILEIKSERLRAAEAVAHVRAELDLLLPVVTPILAGQNGIGETKSRLLAVNRILWDAEERLREKEKSGDFGPEFIALARSVYRTNDERMALKRKINSVLPCGLVEEKSYSAVGPGAPRGS